MSNLKDSFLKIIIFHLQWNCSEQKKNNLKIFIEWFILADSLCPLSWLIIYSINSHYCNSISNYSDLIWVKFYVKIFISFNFDVSVESLAQKWHIELFGIMNFYPIKPAKLIIIIHIRVLIQFEEDLQSSSKIDSW